MTKPATARPAPTITRNAQGNTAAGRLNQMAAVTSTRHSDKPLRYAVFRHAPGFLPASQAMPPKERFVKNDADRGNGRKSTRISANTSECGYGTSHLGRSFRASRGIWATTTTTARATSVRNIVAVTARHPAGGARGSPSSGRESGTTIRLPVPSCTSATGSSGSTSDTGSGRRPCALMEREAARSGRRAAAAKQETPPR